MFMFSKTITLFFIHLYCTTASVKVIDTSLVVDKCLYTIRDYATLLNTCTIDKSDDALMTNDKIGSLCDGYTCGDFTFDSLSKGYQGVFVSIDQIKELQTTSGFPGFGPETESDTIDHDNDKCCPTFHAFSNTGRMTNVYGQEKEIVRFNDHQQLIPVGDCVSVPWGCQNCQQMQRIHTILAMDLQTGDIMLDIFYVNSYCSCVQK